ncbi:hypothetical protein BC830DRAFT_298843 [Chytriomyces sp. MP71]|nr:hypothetical protein BC830DRAFT_298843 [Chytriomyces sp. MP71]
MSATDGRRWPVASATGVCLIVVIAVLVLATEIVTLTPTNLKLSHDRLQGLPLSTNFNALSCDTRVTDLGFIDAQTGVWVSTAVDGKGEGDRSEDCAQGDHLASLLDAAKTKRLFPEYLQNRTVLLLGDSFDVSQLRFGLFQIGA